MPEFTYTFSQYASHSVTVEAESREAGEDAAWNLLPASLCHQCAREYELCGDWGLVEEDTDSRTIDPDTIADEFGIQSLAAQNGVATLATVPTTEQARELVLTMSLACGRMLDDDQAQNYVEFEASPAGQPGYIVHVRRAGGPSPHTLRREAEARAAELEKRLDRVTDLFEAWAAEENEHRAAGELGIAEGLHVAIEALREAVHG